MLPSDCDCVIDRVSPEFDRALTYTFLKVIEAHFSSVSANCCFVSVFRMFYIDRWYYAQAEISPGWKDGHYFVSIEEDCIELDCIFWIDGSGQQHVVLD